MTNQIPKGSDEADLRTRMLLVCRQMNASGINQGTSGNLSARIGPKSLLITPSGLPYESLTEDGLALLEFDGQWIGPSRPSSEWRIHRDILAARSEVGAVLHAHSTHCTALACLGLGIPAFHYMVAVAGGQDIRCAPYATFGTQSLSDHALAALDGRKACLLANHGLLALGATPEKALALAIEVETLAQMYILARGLGEPTILDAAEMERVLALFRTYGTPDFPDAELRQKAPSSRVIHR
jgi:L-fuculose-phosphate aldolase